MPRVAFTLGSPSRMQIESGLDRTGLLRSLVTPRRWGRMEITTGLVIAGRLRSGTPPGQLLRGTIRGVSQMKVRLIQRALLTASVARIQTSVLAFLSSIPTPQPAAKLLLHSLTQAANPAAAPTPFSGTYLRGETIPLRFEVRGQRLNGLRPIFTACMGPGSSARIEKRGAQIQQTDITSDPATRIEVIGYSFTIDSADTLVLPDTGEFEFEWLLIVDDGLGRQHFLDKGTFKIYNHC